MRRNRSRIVLLAIAGLVNYWIAVLVFIVAVLIGTIGILFVRGVLEGGDFGLAWKIIRGIPGAIAWAVAAGWLSSPVMAWLFWGFIAIGTLMAFGMMRGRLGKLERSLPSAGAADERVAGILEAVAIAAGVPAPPLAVLEDVALNSCSVGRKPERATIVVTRGLVDGLTRDELEAVLAYELSRVTSFDTGVATWTSAVTGRTIELSEKSERVMVQLALVVSVRLARRLRARTLRRQAGQRDILALGFTRYPEALLSALEKIEADKKPVVAAGAETAPLWLEWPWPDAREADQVPALGSRIQELRTLVSAVGT